MPDKKESYMSANDNSSISSSNYQDLAPSAENLHSDTKKDMPLSNQIENNNVTPCHTAFPVDLKEVFELTSPSEEIHQTMMRSTVQMNSVSMQYSSELLQTSKEPEVESHNQSVNWRHVLSEQPAHTTESGQMLNSLKETSNDEQGTWENVIEEQQNLTEVVTQDEILHATKLSQISTIDNQEEWNVINKQPIENEEHVHQGNKVTSQIIPSEDHATWNHVLNEIPNHTSEMPHSNQIVHHTESPQVLNGHKQWNNILTEQGNQNGNTQQINISRDCPKLPEILPKRRDASCQVDDIPVPQDDDHNTHENSVSGQENSVQTVHMSKENITTITTIEDVPHNLLNLTIVTEAPSSAAQVVVHNGIRPELYTQERHMVVQVGTKAQNNAKTSNNYPCNHCGKVFMDSRSLQRHMLIHIGLRPYRCPVCGKAFMLNGDLTRHIRIHSGERPYACEVCGRRFTLKGNLMQHFRTHTPEKQYACTICEKNYAQKDSLHRHIRAHFGEKPFECTTCGKRFTLKGDLSRHILIHSGVKPHSCKFCGRQFALKGNLTQHVRTHVRTQSKSIDGVANTFIKNQSEPQLICDLSYSHIPKTIVAVPSSASSLKLTPAVTSVQNTSLSNTFPYVQTSSENSHQSPSAGLSFCSECSKTFPSPDSLHEHVQLIHEQSTRLASNHYLCNICQKEFCLKGDLTRHLNSHNGVKPYECEHCNKTFTLKSNLRQHLTTHRVEKNFSCPMCSKSFGNRRNLNLHLRRHEQARANFTCTKCGRSFLAKSDHFFHDCVKNESSSSSTTTSTSSSSSANLHSLSSTTLLNGNTSSSPLENVCSTAEPFQPNVELPAQTSVPLAVLPVKRESCHLPCDNREQEEIVESSTCGITSVNGTTTFLGPFYRHLYFSTSHQTMLPTLKGLLHAASNDVNIADYNRIAKTS